MNEPVKKREKWEGFRRQPHGLLRFGLRLPILLYRAGLGWLLGDRFLLLTHVGRRSGLKRRTVLEVVQHDKANDRWYAAAAWGMRSDWYRNVLKDPQVELTLGSRTATFRAEIQPAEQAAPVFLDYARRHPLAFGELAALIVGRGAGSIEETCQAMARDVPLVGFLRLEAARRS